MNIFVSVTALATITWTVSAEVDTSIAWGYHSNATGLVDTTNWSSEWSSCGGIRQSPIDITTTGMCGHGDELPLKFRGSCSEFNLTAPHEPLEADVVGGDCVLSINDNVYSALQFHLHAPSEHTINGKAFDASIHFVHASEDGEALAVVGLFLEVGAQSDPWLAPLLDVLENVSSTNHTEALVVQLKSYSSLIIQASQSSAVYNYPGSLTTPGCDETVDWWVVQKPLKISATDYNRLHQDLLEYEITDNGYNARPVQPLNGRTVTRYN